MSDQASRDSILRAFRKAHREWPSFVSDSAPQAEKAWFALEADKREAAARAISDYVATCKRLKLGGCTFAVYLREHRWEKLEDAGARKEDQRLRPLPAPPFGPLFGAVRAWLLLKGPIAVDMPGDLRAAAIQNYEVLRRGETGGRAYLRRKGLEVATDGSLVFPDNFESADTLRRLAEAGYPEVNALHAHARRHAESIVPAKFAPLAELCEPVPVDGDVFAAWLSHDECEGWPALPDPGQMTVIWLPKGGPQELGEFERRAKRLLRINERQDDERAA